MNDEPKDAAQVVPLGDRWVHFIIEGGEEVNVAKLSPPDKSLKGPEGEEELKDNPSAPPS